MALSLMGCCPRDFGRENGPLRHSGKQPIEVGKWPIKEWKRPVKEGKRPVKPSGLFFGHPTMVENGPCKEAHQEVYEPNPPLYKILAYWDFLAFLGFTQKGSCSARGRVSALSPLWAPSVTPPL